MCEFCWHLKDSLLDYLWSIQNHSLRFNSPPNFMQRSFEIPPICSYDLHVELTLQSNCACDSTLTELLNADVWKQLYGQFEGSNPTWWSVSIPQYHFDAISTAVQIPQGWYASSWDSVLTNKLLGHDWVFKIWQWHQVYGQYQDSSPTWWFVKKMLEIIMHRIFRILLTPWTLLPHWQLPHVQHFWIIILCILNHL